MKIEKLTSEYGVEDGNTESWLLNIQEKLNQVIDAVTALQDNK